MGINSKSKYVYRAIFIIVLYIVGMCVLCFSDIIKNRQFLSEDAYFNSNDFRNRIVEYWANVRSFCIEGIEIKQQSITSAEKHNNEDKSANCGHQQVEQELSMKYYIVNNNNGKVYTNIKDTSNINEYIKANSLHVEEFPRDTKIQSQFESINYWFNKEDYKGKFIFIKSNDIYSQIKKNFVYYNSIRSRLMKEIKILSFLTIFTLILFFVIKKFCRESFEYYFRIKNKYESFPLDIRVIIFVFFEIFLINYLENMFFFYLPLNSSTFVKLTIVSFATLFFVINVHSILSIVHSKDKFQYHWRTSFIFQSTSLMKQSVKIRKLVKKEIWLTISSIFFGVCIICAIYCLEKNVRVLKIVISLYMPLYMMIIPNSILKRVRGLTNIMKGTESIVSGKIDYTIDVSENTELAYIANNINSMSTAFRNSMESQIKSERLKTELITNVSHDLKTPLTSIINYVKILKEENISEDQRQKYIDVLDKKSQRLKILIEDLFEAAKASSGTMELNVEKVDIAMLLNQALGEFEDKISKSTLTFKINIPHCPVYINVDGRRTWRVFENIIGNALKYSQSGSRVYIQLEKKDYNVVITIKNVSSYEMNFDVSEIFDRFKRGDKARSTDGSGLGLSIAKSLVELQGGSMNIEIDGDLFKAIIKLPLLQ